ncbi:hypothetical protein AB0K34_05245 [Actinomadura sp. NPDC049382]|uniref:hypothetical protein n=1 Tax=Actinomadura sp. NPDC049382 TaxID=3158220 RepID=UPI00342BA252
MRVLVDRLAGRAEAIIAVSLLLGAVCGIAGHVGALPGTAVAVLVAVLLLAGVGPASAAIALEGRRTRKGIEEIVSAEVVRLGAALDRLAFDPGADGVTPEMARLHEEALDAHRAAAEVPVEGRAERVQHDLERGYQALRELELQWLGEPVTDADELAAPSSEEASIADIAARGGPRPPLHVFRGRGGKLLRIPADLPAQTVFELKGHGQGTTRFGMRRWKISPDRPQSTVTGDGVVRGLFHHRWLHEYRYIRIASDAEWTLSFLDRAGVPRFESRAQGSGDDVVLYTGGPGVAELSHSDEDGGLVSELGSGFRHLRTAAIGHRPTFTLAGPTLLRFQTSSPWTLDVRPATGEELRSFATEIEGSGCEPIRFTGGTSRVTVRHSGDGDFDVVLLGPDFTHRTTLISKDEFGDPTSTTFETTLLLKEGSILQVMAEEGDWTIQTTPDQPTAPSKE